MGIIFAAKEISALTTRHTIGLIPCSPWLVGVEVLHLPCMLSNICSCLMWWTKGLVFHIRDSLEVGHLIIANKIEFTYFINSMLAPRTSLVVVPRFMPKLLINATPSFPAILPTSLPRCAHWAIHISFAFLSFPPSFKLSSKQQTMFERHAGRPHSETPRRQWHSPHPLAIEGRGTRATRSTHASTLGVCDPHKPTRSIGHQQYPLRPIGPNPKASLQHTHMWSLSTACVRLGPPCVLVVCGEACGWRVSASLASGLCPKG